MGGKEILLGIQYSPNIIVRSLKWKAFFFFFKPWVLKMLSGLARKTSLFHVSVLELF